MEFYIGQIILFGGNFAIRNFALAQGQLLAISSNSALFSILGTKNKVFVFLNWVWNYITYDQSLRLIMKAKEKK